MQISLQHFKKIKEICKSPLKEVYLVKRTNRNSRSRQRKGTIAKYYLNFECSDVNIKSIEKEFRIICNLHHPFLNKYFGYSLLDNKTIIILSEYIPNGSLSNFIGQSNKDLLPPNIDDTHKLFILYGIASGMAFLHSRNIIHRNLKSGKVFLDEDLHPIIVDYCTSTIPFTDTPIYLAPEIIGNHQYSKEGDVYAFGIIAYELFSKKIPFEHLENEQIFENVINGKRPEIDPSINPAIIKLIENCWCQDPSKRPTFKDITDNIQNDPSFIEGRDPKLFLDFIDNITNRSKNQEPKKEAIKNTPIQKIPQPKENQVQNMRRKIILKLISPSDVKHQPRIYQKGEIHFTSNTDFDNFQQTNWIIGDTYTIEFFSGVLTPVILLDASSDITFYVDKMKQDPVIFLDLEYVIPYKPAPPVCLFQFCCSSGAFLFKQCSFEVNVQMKNFLAIESGYKFVGKGVSGDIQRLKQMFGNDFEIDLEDVENTRLLPYGESANFDQMVLKFAGQPMAQFKDKKVSRSNWSKARLSMKQVIYSAFDVVSLYRCYPSFKPQRHFMYVLPPEHALPSKIDIKKRFSEFVTTTKNETEIETIWNTKSEMAAEMLGLDLNVVGFVVKKCLKTTQGRKFSCSLCPKLKYLFAFELIIHCTSCHHVECSAYKNNDNFKSLFLDYLFLSGRVILGTSKCLLCDTCFNSNTELENHCWNSHCDLLNELLRKKTPKNQRENDDANENNVDDDIDDDNNDES